MSLDSVFSQQVSDGQWENILFKDNSSSPDKQILAGLLSLMCRFDENPIPQHTFVNMRKVWNENIYEPQIDAFSDPIPVAWLPDNARNILQPKKAATRNPTYQLIGYTSKCEQSGTVELLADPRKKNTGNILAFWDAVGNDTDSWSEDKKSRALDGTAEPEESEAGSIIPLRPVQKQCKPKAKRKSKSKTKLKSKSQTKSNSNSNGKSNSKSKSKSKSTNKNTNKKTNKNTNKKTNKNKRNSRSRSPSASPSRSRSRSPSASPVRYPTKANHSVRAIDQVSAIVDEGKEEECKESRLTTKTTEWDNNYASKVSNESTWMTEESDDANVSCLKWDRLKSSSLLRSFEIKYVSIVLWYTAKAHDNGNEAHATRFDKSLKELRLVLMNVENKHRNRVRTWLGQFSNAAAVFQKIKIASIKNCWCKEGSQRYLALLFELLSSRNYIYWQKYLKYVRARKKKNKNDLAKFLGTTGFDLAFSGVETWFDRVSEDHLRNLQFPPLAQLRKEWQSQHKPTKNTTRATRTRHIRVDTTSTDEEENENDNSNGNNASRSSNIDLIENHREMDANLITNEHDDASIVSQQPLVIFGHSVGHSGVLNSFDDDEDTVDGNSSVSPSKALSVDGLVEPPNKRRKLNTLTAPSIQLFGESKQSMARDENTTNRFFAEDGNVATFESDNGNVATVVMAVQNDADIDGGDVNMEMERESGDGAPPDLATLENNINEMTTMLNQLQQAKQRVGEHLLSAKNDEIMASPQEIEKQTKLKFQEVVRCGQYMCERAPALLNQIQEIIAELDKLSTV